MSNLAIVIPTYNERASIHELLAKTLRLFPQARIIVVDDNSPDGTARVVEEVMREHPQVRLIRRVGQRGMASAYLDVFAKLLPDGEIDYIATMDADLSHDPADLKRMADSIGDCDMVIGSRYVPGGQIINWAPWRLFISKYGSIYTRAVVGVPFRDVTTGLALYRKEALARVLARVVPREPYAYQTEMKYRIHRAGGRGKEVPITFRERASGKSKFKGTAVWEALFFPWYLRFFS